MISSFQAAVLGTIQGLTEILPISSSAHLAVFPWLVGWEDPGLSFDVALHIGTLFAILLYFYKDWLDILLGAAADWRSKQGRLLTQLALATIPGALAGLLLEKYAESVFRNPALIAAMLIVFGLWLDWADRAGTKRLTTDELTLPKALLIGASQALAIIPGVSRSGITMTAGLMEGLTKEEAARFSFLLATPIIFGAGVHKLKHLHPADLNGPFWLGIGCSAIVGLLSIGALMAWLKRSNFRVFTIYRTAVGLVIIAIYCWKGA